jgi:hypothetical protein
MYKFVVNKDEKWQGIGLTEKAGRWQGVVYRYGKVNFEEDKDNTLSFDWELLDSNGLEEEVFECSEFQNILGDILIEIIDDQLANGDLEYDDRENDTK